MKKIPRLFVLCYPHLGLLDNWLPVMNSMNNMANYLNFTLVIPDVTTIKSFHGDNALIKISDNIFDTVLIHAYEDTWIKHESVFDSMKWYQTNKVMFRLFGILERLKKKHMFFYILIWPLALLRNKIFKKKYRLEYKEFGRNMSKLDILFYDIATEGNTNPVVSSVLQLFKNSKYSFPHAISMSALEKKSVVL